MLHEYQREAVSRLMDHERYALFLDMGLGKTLSTLTAIERLMYERFEISRVLVIAPKQVAVNTWAKEVSKWPHLQHLRVAVCVGDVRTRVNALASECDIVVVNVDVVDWLVKRGAVELFDMVVIDESSMFKSAATARFKALKKHLDGKRVVLLSGTPTPNGLGDLYSQMYLLDQGERLGRTLGAFRERYFRPGRRNGYTVYEWLLRKGAEEQIHEAVADICMSMKAKDYLSLPDRIDLVEEVEVDLSAMEEIKRELCLGEEVTAGSAGVLANKLKQMANGFVYTDEGKVVDLHKAKVERLVDIVERSDSNVLIFYEYKEDLERIKQAVPGVEGLDEDRWNKGMVKAMALHPKSAGHGLNLQAGGSVIVWFGMPWSLELYEQACARLHRQGQSKPVRVYHLVAKDMIDEDVMQALRDKSVTQERLLEAVKRYV